MKKLLAILMILTFSSCMVSTKVFDATVSDLQNQIDSKLPRSEFEYKDQLVRQAFDEVQKNCCEVKTDTIK
jgi:peptidoglycan hydrolase CwlO-like protein